MSDIQKYQQRIDAIREQYDIDHEGREDLLKSSTDILVEYVRLLKCIEQEKAKPVTAQTVGKGMFELLGKGRFAP